jgi:hypothetical protein
MLHRLPVAGDRDDALRRDGGVQRRQRCPAEQDDEKEDDDAGADANVALRIVRRGIRRIGFDDGREKIRPAFPLPACTSPD